MGPHGHYVYQDLRCAETATTADDASDTSEYDDAGGDDRSGNLDSQAANVSLGAIFARLAVKGLIWLALAGLVGYRATQRNRGFFKWALMALILSPALIYFVLRVLGPAEEMAWRGSSHKAEGRAHQSASSPSHSAIRPARPRTLNLRQMFLQ